MKEGSASFKSAYISEHDFFFAFILNLKYFVLRYK